MNDKDSIRLSHIQEACTELIEIPDLLNVINGILG